MTLYAGLDVSMKEKAICIVGDPATVVCNVVGSLRHPATPIRQDDSFISLNDKRLGYPDALYRREVGRTAADFLAWQSVYLKSPGFWQRLVYKKDQHCHLQSRLQKTNANAICRMNGPYVRNLVQAGNL